MAVLIQLLLALGPPAIQAFSVWLTSHAQAGTVPTDAQTQAFIAQLQSSTATMDQLTATLDANAKKAC